MGIPGPSCGRSTEQELGVQEEKKEPLPQESCAKGARDQSPENLVNTLRDTLRHFSAETLSGLSLGPFPAFSQPPGRNASFLLTYHSYGDTPATPLPTVGRLWLCESLYRPTQGNAYSSLPRAGRSAVLSIPGPQVSWILFSFWLQSSL